MIKAENVNYIYQQGMPFERQALYDVNIEIEDGSLVALIGHTGSGKSTLIQHFNALVKPTSGKIIINGIDVTAPKADLRLVRKTVGLVFQYPEHQLFEETVYKDIAFGPKNMGFSDEEIDKRVRESAALVGLKEKHLTRSPFDLSGGQKRRVAIAGVLAMNPKVLILDEPTVGLDPKQIIEIRDVIKELSKSHTIILSSHILSEVSAVCNRVIIINKGRLVASGTPDRLSESLSQDRFKIKLKGDRESIINAYKSDNSFSTVEESETTEEGTTDLIVEGVSGVDTREAVFDNAVKNGFKLLMIKSEKLSLEEVFLQVTENENFSLDDFSNSTAQSSDLADNNESAENTSEAEEIEQVIENTEPEKDINETNGEADEK